MTRFEPRSVCRPLAFAAALLLLLPLAACGDDDALPIHDDPAPVGPVSSRDTAGSPPPATSPPAAQRPTGSAAAGGSAASAAGLAWQWPAGWQPRPPSNQMRMAEASIPGEAGPADVTVFFFGPNQGGGVEANIQRWVGQMEIDAGSEPRRESFSTGDYQVTWVDVEGTLQPSMMGMGPDTPQPGSRLLGAVVEGAGGPWFFKATGPSATLDAAREDFLAMLRAAGPA